MEDARPMRRGQPTILFGLTMVVGLARLFAYAGMPLGQEYSLVAIVHYLAVHATTFALAAFLVAALSRATATRAAQVALYAQGVLFLAPFVDVGLGVSVRAYDLTYPGIFGTPGAIVASIAYGGVVAWGLWDASTGAARAREIGAAAGMILGVVGLSFATLPWIRSFVEPLHWGVHLVLAVYFGFVAAILEHASIRLANPDLHRAMWREVQLLPNLGFALMPIVGVVAAGRLALPPNPSEPFQRFQIEAPYMVGAAAVGAILFIQWRLVRSRAWEPFHWEAAAAAKIAALSLALCLGVGPFLAAGLAASLLWVSRSRWNPIAFGAAAGLAVLVGEMTTLALNFATIAGGPASFLVPIDAAVLPTGTGVVAAAAVAILVALGSWFTTRTSGSATGRASS